MRKLLLATLILVSLLTSSSFLIQQSTILPKKLVASIIQSAAGQTSDELRAPPQSIQGLGAITGSEHSLIAYCEVTSCVPPIQQVNRQIFQRPFLPVPCDDSLLELKPGFLPTSNIRVLAGQIAKQYNLQVLYIADLQGYKAIAIKRDQTGSVYRDTRFTPVVNLPCNEFILQLKPELLPTTNILSVAAQIAKVPGSYVHQIYNLASYKGISIRSAANNPLLNDERFIKYNLPNNAGVGELDEVQGHIAQLAIRWNQILPDGIKRTVLEPQASQIPGNISLKTAGAVRTANIPNPPAQSNITANLRNAGVNADIAILDTGISLTHPDLNVYRNVSFVQGTSSGDDDNGHGSHVAGIAAAKNNSIGIVGAAPGARLWAIKVCDASGECQISNIIQGIAYAIKHANEIDVLNISLENPNSPALNSIIKEAVKAGITVVASAGNWGKSAASYSPANSPDVLTVSAIGDSDGKCGANGPDLIVKDGNSSRTIADDNFAFFSNFGPTVKMSAPGINVLSTWKGNGYSVDSGTSMAAPYVAGTAAVFKAQFPKATPSQVMANLESSGSLPQTVCDGGPHGYFYGDTDGLSEPLLFRRPGGTESPASPK